MCKCGNVQVWKCASVEMYKCANLQVCKCVSVKSASVQMCKCTNVQVCKSVSRCKIWMWVGFLVWARDLWRSALFLLWTIVHDRICCRRYHLHTVFSASCSRVLGITKVATHMTFVSPVCYQTPTFLETRLFRSYLLSESIINALCMRLKSFLSLRTVFALDGNTKPLNERRKLLPELVDFFIGNSWLLSISLLFMLS